MNEFDKEINKEPIDFYQTGLGLANGTAKLAGAVTTGLGDYYDWLGISEPGIIQEHGKRISDAFRDDNNQSREYNGMTNLMVYGVPLAALSLIKNPAINVALGSAINAGKKENEGKEYTDLDRAIDLAAYGIGRGFGVFAPAGKEFIKRNGGSFSDELLDFILPPAYRGAGKTGTKEYLNRAFERE